LSRRLWVRKQGDSNHDGADHHEQLTHGTTFLVSLSGADSAQTPILYTA
jgi:hypothetical protein